MKVNWISCKRFVIMMLNILILVQISSCTKESNLHPQHGPMPSPAPDEPVYMNLTSATQAINSNIGGYFVALPSNYTKTSNTFPLLVYMHGAGQMGNGSTDLHLLLKDGVAQVLRDKKFPGSFTVNGNTHSLIVLMPQVKSFPGTYTIEGNNLSLAFQNNIHPDDLTNKGIVDKTKGEIIIIAKNTSANRRMMITTPE